MTQTTFDDLRWLHLLWAVLAVAAVGVYGVWQRNRALRIFAAAPVLGRLTTPTGWPRPLARLGLVTAALILLTAAIIGPRWGEREIQVYRRGIDVMVLLDVSRSMLARDLVPNRLERAKLSIRDDLLPALGGDRVGLIAFAGVPSLMCPLTSDYGFFRMALDDAGPGAVARGGTMIGDAIRMAGEAFDEKLDNYKIILLITDGEDHESFPVDAAAALWRDRRVPVVAVALGDEREGSRIPVPADGGERYLEHDGEVVRSRADFAQLRRIAAASDLNRFVGVGTRNFDLGEIYRTAVVPFVQHREREETQNVPLPSRYHPFAVAALVALLVESFMREGRPGPAAAFLRTAAASSGATRSNGAEPEEKAA